MTELTRTVNRALARTVGVQAVRAGRRPVTLSKPWFATLVHFNNLLREIEQVDGDVVECGVAAGASLATLASLIVARGESRCVWGFDSWDGLPAPCDADHGELSIAAAGMFSEASAKKVREELSSYGLIRAEIDRMVRLVPGWFSETLPRYQGRIALLHIDVDLYRSYRDSLTTLWPLVEPGGIVAFDEYGEWETWPGARRAVDEFFSAHAAEATNLCQDEASGKWWIAKSRAQVEDGSQRRGGRAVTDRRAEDSRDHSLATRERRSTRPILAPSPFRGADRP